jgi:transposase
LLPNLPEKSIIVLDNALTHSRQYSRIPTQANNKKFITEWLTKNNISYPENARKCDLLDLVKRNAPEKCYSVDKIIENSGRKFIRLPPYHCQFNAIEMVWSQMKQFFGKYNLDNNFKQIYDLIIRSLNEITSENWQNYIKHCKDLENNYWISDNISDQNFENVILNFGEESESDTDDEELTFSEILAENNYNINNIYHSYCKKLF